MVVDVIETHTNHCWGFDDHSNAASKLMNVRRKVFARNRGNEFLGGCGIRRNTSITAM